MRSERTHRGRIVAALLAVGALVVGIASHAGPATAETREAPATTSPSPDEPSDFRFYRGPQFDAMRPALADAVEADALVTHEFGHVLGLGHSLSEDSAMSYSWNQHDTVNVTQYDVESFLALVRQPNGMRVDGEPLLALQRDGRR